MITSRCPPELFYQILVALDDPTLRLSCLVNQQFYSLAQGLLCRLHLSGTLERLFGQCNFFLADENQHLYSRVRKLSLDLFALPVYGDEALPSQLITLLVKLGPQINSLHINGETFDDELSSNAIVWKYLSPMFRSCIYQHLLPSVRFLKLSQVDGVPLFTILRNAPLLRHMHLGSDYGLVSSPLSEENSPLCAQGKITSLSVGPFNNQTDFHTDNTLAKFIEVNARNIHSLHLGSYDNATTLRFLSSCPTFTQHLLHLSIGTDLFNVATTHRLPDMLPLSMLPRLETLSLSIFFPYHSFLWFNWKAKCLQANTFTRKPSSLPLKKIYSSITYRSGTLGHIKLNDFTYNLDDLAQNPQLNCSMEFSVPISNGNEILQSIFADLRALFPSWDNAGRL
ncbi:hypothetical protein DL96DRAFT_1581223, partial [Flagelloscypha sp. PMI_526]